MASVLTCAMLLWSGAVSQTEPDDGFEIPRQENLSNLIDVDLRVPRSVIPVGGDVIVEFVVQNRTRDPLTLAVPNAAVAKSRRTDMVLPLEHVYSGVNFRGLEVATDGNPKLGDRVTRKPEYPVDPIRLAPFGSVGLRFNVARFYPVLHQAGTYVLRWSPYGGAVQSRPVTIEVVQFKQVVMETDYGSLTIRLLYDKAPRHVENFLDLIRRREYNNKTFHAVFPNHFIIGGCPNGDGSGKRTDGVCLEPEFNDTPFEFGTLAMALIESAEERDINSASCQFFISLSRQPAWDRRYTAFARVEGPESLATLRKLSEVAIDKNGRPAEPLKIKSMSIVDLPYPARLLES